MLHEKKRVRNSSWHTVVVKTDSLIVDQISNEDIIKYLQQPNRKFEFDKDINCIRLMISIVHHLFI